MARSAADGEFWRLGMAPAAWLSVTVAVLLAAVAVATDPGPPDLVAAPAWSWEQVAAALALSLPLSLPLALPLALSLALPLSVYIARRWRSGPAGADGGSGACVAEIARGDNGIALAESFLANSGEAVVVADRRGIILSVNPAYTRITGYGEEEACGRRPRFLLSARQDRRFFVDMWRTLRRSGRWVGEVDGCRRSGESHPLRLHIVAVRDAARRITHYLAIGADIGRTRNDEALIQQMRNFDALTGLPNWDVLLHRLRQEIQAAGRDGGALAVLFVDLDRFTSINDTLGHRFGDYIIATMAERLVGCVGVGNLVARRGGDQFCIVLRQADAEQAAEAVAATARRLLHAVAEPVRIFEQDYALTASIGITRFPVDGDDPSLLLGHAGAAMHQAKRDGRNTFQFYRGEFDSATLERLAIDRGLRRAVANGELQLHYQPQVSLDSGRVIGVEALLRWQHPEMGTISPARFIPLAEESGQIIAIGEWVLREACRQGRAWHDAGQVGLQIAVNLSPRQFRQEDLAARIEEILAESGLAPECLELEITEGALMADPAAAANVLSGLKRRGIRFSVDDFGTGYSSLGYLKRFPLDRLKIDRSFVHECCSDRQDAAIVDAVIGLAGSLGLQVLAEGVESTAQLDFLHRHGCHFGQGYLFGKPLPAAQITALLADGGIFRWASSSDGEGGFNC